MKRLAARCWSAASLAVSLLAAASGTPTEGDKPGRKDRAAYETAYKAGMERFEKACKTAGKSVPPLTRRVPGIRLDVAPGALSLEQGSVDPDWPFAGMPRERMGEKFVASFLDFTFHDNDLHADFVGGRTGMTTTMKGFPAVDVLQKDGTYVRYRLKKKSPHAGMVGEPVPRDGAFRHVVSVEPLKIPGGREHWVGGSWIRVVDGETGQVLGEVRAAAFALPPEGVKASELGKRSWERSVSCPKYLDIQTAMTRMSLIGIVDPQEPARTDPASVSLDEAVREGALREASWADVDAWDVAMKFPPPKHKPARGIQPSRTYIVLKSFALPAGLHGAHSADFYVPKGVPRPTGDPGHSRLHDYNTMTCEGPGCRRR